jgi:glycosyltransferase involved in cell wall biosynthesis
MGTYNPKRPWLCRALNSAAGLFDEYIIVDDGSAAAVEGLPGMKVLRHECNLGFYQARNTGVNAATGDIIAWLDDDDYLNRDGVVALKKHIESSSADIWHFVLQEFNQGDVLYGVDASPDRLVLHSAIPSQSWYRKTVWQELGGYTYPLAEDWDFLLRAFKRGFKFQYFPEVVYYYNRRSDSVSASWIGEKFEAMQAEILKRNGIT